MIVNNKADRRGSAMGTKKTQPRRGCVIADYYSRFWLFANSKNSRFRLYKHFGYRTNLYFVSLMYSIFVRVIGQQEQVFASCHLRRKSQTF